MRSFLLNHASPISMGLIIHLEGLLSRLSKVDMFASCLGIGSVFDFEAGQRLKAIIFMENFAEGSEAKEVSLEFGFKLILFWLSIYYYSKEELDYYYYLN